MKATWALFTLFVMLSCGSWFTPPRSTSPGKSATPALASASTGCPRQQVVLDLIADLEQCEAAVTVCDMADAKAASSQQGQAQAQVREKVVYKTKQCADEGPVLEPVNTTKCADGQLCLDDKAQLAYARNQMAVEAWIKRVNECESQ